MSLIKNNVKAPELIPGSLKKQIDKADPKLVNISRKVKPAKIGGIVEVMRPGKSCRSDCIMYYNIN